MPRPTTQSSPLQTGTDAPRVGRRNAGPKREDKPPFSFRHTPAARYRQTRPSGPGSSGAPGGQDGSSTGRITAHQRRTLTILAAASLPASEKRKAAAPAANHKAAQGSFVLGVEPPAGLSLQSRTRKEAAGVADGRLMGAGVEAGAFGLAVSVVYSAGQAQPRGRPCGEASSRTAC